MINQAFAEQFIRRIRSQTDYNINICLLYTSPSPRD